MTFIKALILLIIIVAAGLVGFAYSGVYDVSVGSGHNALTAWYLETVRERSIESRAEDLTVPADLDSERRIEAGANHYSKMCAGCHGHPGRDPSTHFEPSPPALYRHAVEPDEAFWVIKNGIKMTAMPQHLDHTDDEIWNIVAFLQRLPQLDEDQYTLLTAKAEKDHDED
jgi:mono/diheme cytochrome c family protein